MAKIIKDYVSKSQKKQRPGYAMKPKYITVHNTANPNKGANAEMHARYLHNGAGGRSVGWHFTVDDTQIVQHLPTNESGWHAGDGGNGVGNRQSIGIEICENSDGDFDKAVENAQRLIAKLIGKHGIPLDNVVPHKHWSGKNCPRKLLNTWNQFKAQIDVAEKTKEKPEKKPSKSKTISQMANEIIAGKHGEGHENRRKSLGISKSEYEKVRAEVNRRAGTKSTPSKPKKSLVQMIQEVIDGKHGNGHAARRKSLGINATEYKAVRDGVNARLKKGGNQKSISQMASEVIAGKHGNGHANRRKSLGINQATYAKVRAEVNKRL